MGRPQVPRKDSKPCLGQATQPHGPGFKSQLFCLQCGRLLHLSDGLLFLRWGLCEAEQEAEAAAGGSPPSLWRTLSPTEQGVGPIADGN